MSANRYRSHLVILPEDDANRQIVLGFLMGTKLDVRRIQVLNLAAGWLKGVKLFDKNDPYLMTKFPKRRLLILVDFDNQGEGRLKFLQNKIPEQLRGRVFILGAKKDPEQLKSQVDLSFELLGQALAEECRTQELEQWKHELLIHNKDELKRLMLDVRPFLFD